VRTELHGVLRPCLTQAAFSNCPSLYNPYALAKKKQTKKTQLTIPLMLFPGQTRTFRVRAG